VTCFRVECREIASLFFPPWLKITCRDGRTHGACQEADIVGRKELEYRGRPPAHPLPSAQLGGHSGLSCQHCPASSPRLQEQRVFQRASGPRQLNGQREVCGGGGVPFSNLLSVPRVRQGPYPSLSSYQQAPDTDWAWLFGHEACFKNEKLEVVGEVEIMLIYAVSTAARIKNSFLIGKLELLTVSLPSSPPLPGFQDWWARGTIRRTSLAIPGSGALPKWKVKRREQSLTRHV